MDGAGGEKTLACRQSTQCSASASTPPLPTGEIGSSSIFSSNGVRADERWRRIRHESPEPEKGGEERRSRLAQYEHGKEERRNERRRKRSWAGPVRRRTQASRSYDSLKVIYRDCDQVFLWTGLARLSWARFSPTKK